jgi:hypothetical protein
MIVIYKGSTIGYAFTEMSQRDYVAQSEAAK